MSSGFITETELSEARKKRQEEWEKVRKPDEPLERPEEPYDARSLYERLKEQKMKKDLEYEEAHKLKNLIRGLDDDEVEFLDFVDRTKMKAEKQQQIEERKELEEFRQRVASLQEKSENKVQLETNNSKPKSKIPNHTSTSSRLSQKSILSGSIVVRKRKNGELIDTVNKSSSSSSSTNNISNTENDSDVIASKQVKLHQEKNQLSKVNNSNENRRNESETQKKEKIQNQIPINSSSPPLDEGALKCIGVLPGIGKYRESSDSEVSTDSEEEAQVSLGKFDLVGRVIQLQKICRKSGDDDDD